MAKNILIASHAHLASGMLSSLKLLTGMGDDITCIDAYVDGNDDYTQTLADFVRQTAGEPAVIFTDLLGGSVNQKVLVATVDAPNITVITQTNLAIIMSVALSTEPLTRDNLRRLVGESQVTIASVAENDDSGDEEF